MCGLAQPEAAARGDEGATEEQAGVMRTAARQGWPRRPRPGEGQEFFHPVAPWVRSFTSPGGKQTLCLH